MMVTGASVAAQRHVAERIGRHQVGESGMPPRVLPDTERGESGRSPARAEKDLPACRQMRSPKSCGAADGVVQLLR